MRQLCFHGLMPLNPASYNAPAPWLVGQGEIARKQERGERCAFAPLGHFCVRIHFFTVA